MMPGKTADIPLDVAKAFGIARALGRARRTSDAIKLAEIIVKKAKAQGQLTTEWIVRLNLFLGSQHAGTGNVEKAAHYIETAFQASPQTVQFNKLNDLLRLYQISGQTAKIRPALDQVMGSVTSLPTGRQYFTFALPKSAGSSLCSSVAEAIGFKHIASGFEAPHMPYYAAALLGPEIARRAGTQRLIHQTHAMPWPANFKILRETAQPRFLVNVRDPRAAVLSYYYMTEQTNLHRLRLLLAVPNYNELSLQERCDRVVELVFPAFIDWLSGWTAYVDSSGGLGMITTFEEFKADAEAVVQRAAKFLSGEEKSARTIYKTHFRKGGTDETDPLMSEARRRELFQQIPEPLRERFGWTE